MLLLSHLIIRNIARLICFNFHHPEFQVSKKNNAKFKIDQLARSSILEIFSSGCGSSTCVMRGEYLGNVAQLPNIQNIQEIEEGHWCIFDILNIFRKLVQLEMFKISRKNFWKVMQVQNIQERKYSGKPVQLGLWGCGVVRKRAWAELAAARRLGGHVHLQPVPSSGEGWD